MSETQSHSQDAITKLGELIDDQRIVMLTTVDPDGHLHSRPMANQELDENGDLWFFTPRTSGKVWSIEREHQVNLSYMDESQNRYVSVSGLALLVNDKQKAEELWSPALKAWFPKGVDDPDLALLKVRVQTAEYWDAPSSTIVKIVGFTKAVVTGQRYDPGTNERLDLQH